MAVADHPDRIPDAGAMFAQACPNLHHYQPFTGHICGKAGRMRAFAYAARSAFLLLLRQH
jgi:hypothetical protein